jgi:predicted MPP superfamily phosphohydrolase
MASQGAKPHSFLTRRGLLKAGVLGAAGMALYSGEIARHWIDETHRDVYLRNLPADFDGVRIVQLSDIHLDEFTEPFFLRRVIEHVNRIAPDYVLITGDYVTAGIAPHRYALRAASQCGGLLRELRAPHRYASLGNHDIGVGAEAVTAALTSNGTPVLRNAFVPLERGSARIWLAGLDDPVEGDPDPELAIPKSIRNQPNEPVIVLCHAPDYADYLLRQPAGAAIDLMLSGHTHGGQVRLPFVGALALPVLGHKYVQGAFRLGRLQLYVNRGIGAVNLPFRLNCPPEITVMTLRAGEPPSASPSQV